MFDVRYSTDFDGDVDRLIVKHPALVEDLDMIIADELVPEGAVSDSYEPHVLDNRGGHYNGCMEFHLADDVLVLFSPPYPKRSLTMRRICTHAELSSGMFGREWPDD
ncbi:MULTISPECIES: type II toxin-antitoxin system YafQ family toxin [Bifidobacterium]|jgi:mRNA interferase YafQ|uniref:Type II toxin-antitoxin system mRNA interferase toxin, RelE/StbE family n=1 Tax=Bifidobacterium tibiigranuli TaxID=2172043 RepID=A0A5N6S3M8_9BIFI|nr:type II toxin-antitoxin system YafQ family toxin [Bifidobacterium tibiigranuli]KAE8128050.1 type II toxin-antitoxin system mRNA interferase toxin, RelE/StbE family [Bifidobacterium tibiigranuli]KAE8128210.1 type II toxin-antitoxin system mRNA interferase toxin, RelE/StbE family [Bifidobacterium tibiigranuli]MCH3974059.1 type II toxin-antitoxin system YafQ family toxin [Bifidobacterium tibiigranuli]MCH4189089.1 type II toxin-antitoxin system YafQ family toxin [Bifidobacterium tibiigranuli]MC